MNDHSNSHYVPNYRPSVESGTADTVFMRVQPRRLIQLNDVDQTFVLDVTVVKTWQDPRLQVTFTNTGGTTVSEDYSILLEPGRDGEPDGSYTISSTPGNADPNRLWNPRMDIGLNFVEKPDTVSEVTQLYTTNGIIFTTQQLKATMSQRLDLTAFPVDKHKLMCVSHVPIFRFTNACLQLYAYVVGIP